MWLVKEIADGDSIEQLLDAGIIEARRFWCANGAPIDGYAVIGGTLIEAELEDSVYRTKDGTEYGNVYGFGHGQRPIYEQAKSGAFLVKEVFLS